MKIITVGNNKGGVGKTTTTGNLGAALVEKGKKVLLIDCDGQSNLTAGLGFNKNAYEKSIHKVLRGDIKPREAILKRDGGIDLIPSAKQLRQADFEFSATLGAILNLQQALDELRNFYDYIIIDCPPHIGFLTNSAMTAADDIFIPVKTEYYSLEGVKDLMDAASKIKKMYNPRLKITGVIATMHNKGIRLNDAVLTELKNLFGEKAVFKTIIRKNVQLAEAPSHGETIFEYAPNSHGAEDYRSLCKEILER